ncbi:tetratricopeptide repeat protein [Dongia sp.]|uniref:tetratricopeptide repeat protein n=1 Tax=Dongia sp. TaxID=1977262 RepID=UPI0035B2DEA7
MHFLARGAAAFLVPLLMSATAVAQENPAPESTPKAAAELNPLLDACLKPADAQTVIVTCTTAIESRQLQGDSLAAALFRRGLTQSQRAQGAAAVNDFSAALKLTPGAVDLLFARASVYAAMKRHDLAIADYDKLLKLVPGDPDSLYRRAWSQAALGRDEAAVRDLSDLLGEAKGDIDALMDRGGLYLRLGKFAQGAADFSAIVSQDEKAAAAFYNRGRAGFLKGDFKAAAKDFAEAERLRTDNPYAALRRYLAAAQADGKVPGQILTETLAKFPPEQWPMPVLATIAGKIPEKDLLASTSVADKNVARRIEAEAHYYLGEAALLKKDAKAARAHFAAAAKGDRSLPEAIDAGWRLKQIP